jgi:tagatose-1,6-bisphosphate aldolase non-catalytic subunit AgaZ/GatZ
MQLLKFQDVQSTMDRQYNIHDRLTYWWSHSSLLVKVAESLIAQNLRSCPILQQIGLHEGHIDCSGVASPCPAKRHPTVLAKPKQSFA